MLVVGILSASGVAAYATLRAIDEYQKRTADLAHLKNVEKERDALTIEVARLRQETDESLRTENAALRERLLKEVRTSEARLQERNDMVASEARLKEKIVDSDRRLKETEAGILFFREMANGIVAEAGLAPPPMPSYETFEELARSIEGSGPRLTESHRKFIRTYRGVGRARIRSRNASPGGAVKK